MKKSTQKQKDEFLSMALKFQKTQFLTLNLVRQQVKILREMCEDQKKCITRLVKENEALKNVVNRYKRDYE